MVFISIFCWHLIGFFSQFPWIGKYHVSDPDSMLYLRWNEQSLVQSEMITKDYYQAFPHTVKVSLPPLPRLVLYHFARFAFIFFPNITCEDAVGFLPPIAGTLVIIGITLFVYLSSKNFALTLCVAALSFPGYFSAMTNTFLLVDHHYLVNLLIWSWILVAWYFIKSENKNMLVLGGIISSGLTLTWVGTPLFFGLLMVLGIYYWLSNKSFVSKYFNYFADSTLIAGGLLGLYFYIHPPEGNLDEISLYGWFNCVSVVALSFAVRFFNNFLREKPKQYVIGVFLIIFAIAYFTFLPLQQGFSFMSNTIPLFKTVGELLPLTSVLTVDKRVLWINNLASIFGPLVVFFIIFLVSSPKKLFNNEGTIIRDSMTIFILLTFNQVRYGRWIAGAFGLIPGVVTYQLFSLLKEALKYKTRSTVKLVLIFVPIIVISMNLSFATSNLPNDLKSNKIDLYNWIETHTPNTDGYINKKLPQYGILNFWDRGNQIAYYAQRPPVVSNTMRGLKTMAEIYSSTTEKEAFELCTKYKVKYIMAEPEIFSSKYINYLVYLKKNLVGSDFGFGGQEAIEKKPQLDTSQTFYVWMTYFAGLKANANFVISNHFRICWVSRPKEKNPGATPECMLFEVVKGCKIKGISKPNAHIQFTLKLKVGGHSMKYNKTALADKNGNFSVTLCYPNSVKAGRIHTPSSYSVKAYNKSRLLLTQKNIQITKEDIENGNIKKLILISN